MEALVILAILFACALAGTGSALTPINLDRIAPALPDNVAIFESGSSGTNEPELIARAL